VENPFHYGTQPYLVTIASRRKQELIALMTPPYKLQIASLNDKSTQAIVLLASELHKGDWHVPTVIAVEEIAKHFESEWNRLTRGQSEYGMRQRIYELRVMEHHDYPSGSFRQATMDDLNCAATWENSFHVGCFGSSIAEEPSEVARSMIENGYLYFWEDPLPVSMVGFTRPTKRGVSISYVYTPPEFRKKGYASAVVASLQTGLGEREGVLHAIHRFE
jgi:hypothetical protein